MKKLFVIALVMAQTYAFSQKIDHVELTVNYIQQPMHSMPKDVKTFTSKIVLSYKESVLAETEAYNKSVADEQQKADDAKKDYQKKSFGEKLGAAVVLGESKPTGAAAIKKPYFPVIYNEDELKSYVKIPGFTPSNDGNGLLITLLLDGFKYSSIADKTSGGYGSTPKFLKEVSCKHSMSIKVEYPVGTIIYDQSIPEFDNFVVNKTSEYPSQGELDKYWSRNDDIFIKQLDEKITRANLTRISKIVESDFGYLHKSITLEFATIIPKKMNYDDYKQATDLIASGITYYNDASQKEQGISDIKKAIDIWEKALTESNVTDKKARIDEDITAETHLNCARAYLWTNDFLKAKMHLSKIKLMDIRKYNRRSAELMPVIDELEKRYNANK